MVCSSLVVGKSKRAKSALLFSSIRRSGEKPKRIGAIRASFPPERLFAQEIGVAPGEPDVFEHPVVEPGEFRAPGAAIRALSRALRRPHWSAPASRRDADPGRSACEVHQMGSLSYELW
jgi:hypothetical protein